MIKQKVPGSLPIASFILLCFLALLGQDCQGKDTFFAKGLDFYKEKDYNQALKCFSSSFHANSNTATSLYYAALCYCAQGAQEQAQALFAQIVQHYPDSREAKLSADYLAAQKNAPKHAPVSNRSTTRSGSASSSDSLPDQVNIPFSKGLGGHLIVEGELNGRRMQMFFDTGANSCCFGQNSLDQAGVSEKATDDAGYAGGVGGNVKVRTMIATVGAGNLKRRLPVLVQNNLFMPLLGQPFYDGYSYEIDNNAGIIRFKKLGSESKSQAFDSIEIPYTEQGSSHIFVEANIDGSRIPVCFDTGAGGGITLSMMQMAAAGINLPRDAALTRVSGVAGDSLAYTFRARVVKVGPIQKTGLQITVLQGSLPCALIGEDFFGQRKYTIDKDKRVIRFSR